MRLSRSHIEKEVWVLSKVWPTLGQHMIDQNDIDGSERECRGLIGLTKCVPLHVFPNAGNTFERKVK